VEEIGRDRIGEERNGLAWFFFQGSANDEW